MWLIWGPGLQILPNRSGALGAKLLHRHYESWVPLNEFLVLAFSFNVLGSTCSGHRSQGFAFLECPVNLPELKIDFTVLRSLSKTKYIWHVYIWYIHKCIYTTKMFHFCRCLFVCFLFGFCATLKFFELSEICF